MKQLDFYELIHKVDPSIVKKEFDEGLNAISFEFDHNGINFCFIIFPLELNAYFYKEENLMLDMEFGKDLRFLIDLPKFMKDFNYECMIKIIGSFKEVEIEDSHNDQDVSIIEFDEKLSLLFFHSKYGNSLMLTVQNELDDGYIVFNSRHLSIESIFSFIKSEDLIKEFRDLMGITLHNGLKMVL